MNKNLRKAVWWGFVVGFCLGFSVGELVGRYHSSSITAPEAQR